MIKATRTQWIKFAVVLALYLIFLVWLRSWLGLVVVPFIFDAYITKKIPWTWWRKSKNRHVVTVMGWVDAIVFALVAVYFVNLYFFQNYVIPSSSLEKSLLTGDYLFVSKMSYGPRVPQTPLHMPLAQHTLPFFNCKSYLEHPQWDYKRVKGLGDVQLNDIVVFNFPAGDTVATGVPNDDVYRLSYGAGKELAKPVDLASMSPEQQRVVYDYYYQLGREYLKENPQNFGEIISRPVDRRENYVKRCVGLPGQTLEIKDRIIYLDGKANKEPDNVQYRYLVKTKRPIPDDLAHELGISKDDTMLIEDSGWESGLLEMGLDSRNAQGKLNPVYHFPLTKKMYETLLGNKKLISKIVMEPEDYAGQMYPLNLYTKWNRNNTVRSGFLPKSYHYPHRRQPAYL